MTDHGPSGSTGVDVPITMITLLDPATIKAGQNGMLVKGEGFQTASITFTKAMPPGGAAVYTGTEIPQWNGDLIIGVMGFDPSTPHYTDYGSTQRNVTLSEVYLRGEYGRLREVAMSPDGGLYVTTSIVMVGGP